VDWEGIPPTAEWLREIRGAIDGADGFLFVITPDSCASEVCHLEIAHALERRKRLIPVLHRETASEAIPPEIARVNWVFLRESDSFASGVAAIITALDTDFEWVADHTRLLVRAVEWDRERRDASYALRGRDLQRFERWLGQAPDKKPEATSLQSEYVLASRRATTRRQRMVWSSVFVAVTVALVLSTVAYFQSRQRDWQQRLAIARQLVNQAESIRALPFDSPEAQGQDVESARLAVTALQQFDALGTSSVEADQALRSSLSILPIRRGDQQLVKESIDASGFDPTGRYLAVAFGDRLVTARDTLLQSEATCAVGAGGATEILAVAASASGDYVAASLVARGTADGAIEVWRLAGCERLFRVAEQGRHENLMLDPQARWVGSRIGSRLLVWDVGTGGVIPTALDADTRVSAAAPDPAGNRLAVAHRPQGSSESRVSIWKVFEGGIAGAWPLEERAPSIRWTADASRLLVGGEKLFRVHDAESGRIVARLPAPKGALVGSADGELLAADVGNYVVEIRAAADGVLRSRIGLNQEVAAMSFRQDNDGPTLVTFGKVDHVAKSWRTGSSAIGELVAPAPIERVWFAPDSTVLRAFHATASKAWRVTADPNRAPTLAPVEGDVVAGVEPLFRVTISPPTARRDRPSWVRVSRVSDDSEVVRKEVDRQIVAAVISGDGSTLAAATGDSSRGGWRDVDLRIWHLATNETVAQRLDGFQDESLGRLLAISHTGRYVGIPSRRGFVFFAGKTARAVTDVAVPFPAGIAFQPGGSLVAIAGSDRRTRVWDLVTRLEIARVADDRPVKSLALSPDGRWLATLTDSGAAKMWAVTPRDLIQQACERLQESCS
jgi:WD40 repeat protein